MPQEGQLGCQQRRDRRCPCFWVMTTDRSGGVRLGSQADWEGRLGDENILSESGVPSLTALPPAAPRVSL